jgi:PKD repeat protein
MNKEARKYLSIPLIILVLISVILTALPFNVVANEPPVAIVDPKYQEVEVGEEAWFTGNSSYDPDGHVIYYSWHFGDGETAIGPTVTHIYSSPGTYVVWLYIYDNENGSARDSGEVTVLDTDTSNEPPVAEADPYYQEVGVGEDAWFSGSNSYDPDGTIVSYEWDFGDGTTGSGMNIYHSYTSPGTYYVVLTVTDDLGATAQDTVIVNVTGGYPTNEPPVAQADPYYQEVGVGESAWFSGSNSYDPDGTIVSYEWDFGDGTTGSGMNIYHSYSMPGEYTVTLTVTDNEGAQGTDTCLVHVVVNYPAPPMDLDAELVTGSQSDLNLAWIASSDDGAGDDDVDGYTIYKSTTGINGLYEYADWIPASGIPAHTYEWTDLGAGDGDWNSYFYIVRVKDVYGNEEQNDIKVGKYAQQLDAGWNLVSVPLGQKDTSREAILQTIEGNYASVQGYHAGKSRPWLNWHRNKPNALNDAIAFDHESGYYIDMITPDYLVTAGKVAATTDIDLKAGWNLIALSVFEEETVENALSSIAGKYNMVEYFDTVTNKEVRLQPDDLIYPGLGYWIHATENCVLTLAN